MALPFPLPRLSAGFAALGPRSRALGGRVAGRAAALLTAELGTRVEVAGRPLPGPPAPAPGVVRLGIALEALPATAVLEVESGLAAGLVDRLAGGDGPAAPSQALDLTPVERSALELLCLMALAAAVEEPEAGRLAPRLAEDAQEPAGALAVELSLAAGGLRGRARLLLSPEALRAVEGPAPLAAPAAGWRVAGWVGSGATVLPAAELAALAPGDVVLLDEPPSGSARLHLPGLALDGRRDPDTFHLEEMPMDLPAEQLTLELTVEVARVSVALADLARLAPGGALPLHAPRDGQVVLRLGERPVARGQLVDLDGALGVRVERLEGQP